MYSWLAWTIFAAVALIVVGFSFWFVAYYKLKNEPAGVTGTIGFFALLFTLLSLFLIPVDVYMVSSHKYDNQLENDVKYTYYGFYLIFMFFVFVALPFAYFYYEELGDLEDRENTCSKRSCTSIKYTAAFAFVWIALIVIGMFVDFSSGSSNDDNEGWKSYITNQFSSNVSRIIPFCMAVLICIGLFFSMIYTSWGMVSFPISLMKSIPVSTVRSRESLDLELRNLQNQMQHMDNKFRGREQDMTAKDRHRKRTLETQKKDLEAQIDSVGNRVDTSNNCCNKCGRCIWQASAPIRYLVGIIMLIWSALLISSIAIHLIDQIINSDCGYSCGFALKKRKLPNLIEIMLSGSSKIFPFDYIIFGLIVFWLFWSTLVGIMMIDVRFLCCKLFSLRPGGTMHNALMMAIMFVILIACSFTYNIYNLAPEYVQFGHQNNCNSCAPSSSPTISADASGLDIGRPTSSPSPSPEPTSSGSGGSTTVDCDCTVVYNLITGIMIGMPIFGLIYFIFSWIFVGVSILSFVVNIVRKPKPKDAKLLNDDDDLEAIFKD